MLKEVSLVLPAPLPGHLPQACQRLQAPAMEIEVFPDLGLANHHHEDNTKPGTQVQAQLDRLSRSFHLG